MAVSKEFRDFVLGELGRITPVTSRAMFGGVGIYSEGLFFALVDDDILFFKVDDSNRGDFLRAGQAPFRPGGGTATSMNYYELPGDLLERPDELREWVMKSIEVARSARRRSR